MCGRFALLTHAEALVKRFKVEENIKRPEPRYNIAPTQNVTVVVQRETRQLTQMRWGLVPSWAKDVSIGNRMINEEMPGTCRWILRVAENWFGQDTNPYSSEKPRTICLCWTLRVLGNKIRQDA